MVTQEKTSFWKWWPLYCLILIFIVLFAVQILFDMRKKPVTDTNNREIINNVSSDMNTKEDQQENTQEFTITDTVIGTGTEAVVGNTVVVNYRGKLTSGQEFDSSYSRNEPFSFTLGARQVIQGWEKGIAGMKVGGKRTLVIPPELGYGSRGGGPIPPNATLIFDVELLDVQ